MASKSECLPPVTIGGITITNELIDAWQELEKEGPEGRFFLTEECLYISAIDLDNYGISRDIFPLFIKFVELMKALEAQKGGGHAS